MDVLDRICRGVDAVNERVGRGASWLVLALTLLQFAIVLMRYVFGVSSVYATELLIYLYAGTFMLLPGYTLLHDGHVRIDILYVGMNAHARALVNLAGGIVLLLPSVAFIGWQSFPYVVRSWITLEGSSTMGGIPLVFVLKTLIPVFCLLLAAQGLSLILRSVRIALGHDDPTRAHRA